MQVGPQPDPLADPLTGRVECRWPRTFSIDTEPTWTSGLYLVRLTRDDERGTFVPIVVRADERKGVGVVQLPAATWQAYNDWGEESLYKDALGLGGGHAREVSFDRPFRRGFGTGRLLEYDVFSIAWLEAWGYDVTYLTGVDVDRDPSLLLGQRAFLSIGHDEYWTRAQRRAVEAARDEGVSLVFPNGNTMYWQVRLEPSSDGRPGRTVVCYKSSAPREDPLAGTELSSLRFRDERLGAPENELLGVMFSQWARIDQPWIVAGAGSWVYEGTGLSDGDTLPLLVGYESDALADNGHTPPGLVALASGPVARHDGAPGWHHASVYEAPSGAFVFTAGTLAWSWGLGKAGYVSAAVQRITANLLARAGLEPAGAGASFGAGAPRPELRDGGASRVTTLAGRALEEGLVDGPLAAARFRRPVGAAVDPQGAIWVADTGNHAIRRVARGVVETVAGDGTAGDELTAARTRLDRPVALAVGGDGAIYVADSGNHRILRLAPGTWEPSVLAGSPDGEADLADGRGVEARFELPSGLALVGHDLYVADTGSHLVRRVSKDGVVATVAGSAKGHEDGPGSTARFTEPTGLLAAGGALLVLDSGGRTVRRVALDGDHAVTTLAGVPSEGGFADGAAAGARFMPQWGLGTLGDDVLVADTGNGRIRRLSGGRVTTWAGSGRAASADGDGAGASFLLPTGVVPLPDGTVLVVEQGASTLRLVEP